jgi:hypothetical protein
MTGRRLLKVALATAVLAAPVATVILLNLALLGYAQPRNDPVGRLSPQATVTPSAGLTHTGSTPAATDHAPRIHGELEHDD